MKISKRKPYNPINERLWHYLEKYDRKVELPVGYSDLMRYQDSFPHVDMKDKPTLWDTLMYQQSVATELNEGLTMLYSLLKTEGDLEITKHLRAERIDYCTFGNSHPFRVRIVNMLNDNYDYMYIKKADASRVYGLELEHLLSPNYISYLADGNTLVEEHIAGIPGDQFLASHINMPTFNKVRFAKEFVKFNERCFVRLLGDMRSYNYVIDITPDFEEEQYRIRAIDFDQQSHEGSKSVYLPQFFKENNPIVDLGMEFMKLETTRQYQFEERTLIARRLNINKKKVSDLIICMKNHELSTPEKINQLKVELNQYHNTKEFNDCKNMGDILESNLRLVLADHVTKLELH